MVTNALARFMGIRSLAQAGVRGAGAFGALALVTAVGWLAISAGASSGRQPAFVVSIARAGLGSDALYLTASRSWVGKAVGTDPAWSTAAGLIAYDHPGQGFEDKGLYVVRPDGSSERRLSPRAGWFPTWSPDGKQIATVCRFRRLTEASGVCITDVATGAVHLFVHYRAPAGGAVWVDAVKWSPDGASLAVAHGVRRRGESPYATYSSKLVVFDVHTHTHQTITSLNAVTDDVAWSSDGRHIAYWEGKKPCHIVLRDLAASRTRSIVVAHCESTAGSWGQLFYTHDGRAIVYALRAAFELVPLDGSPRRRVARVPHVLDGGADLMDG
jgi:Tol biopolymer transport system component